MVFIGYKIAGDPRCKRCNGRGAFRFTPSTGLDAGKTRTQECKCAKPRRQYDGRTKAQRKAHDQRIAFENETRREAALVRAATRRAEAQEKETEAARPTSRLRAFFRRLFGK